MSNVMEGIRILEVAEHTFVPAASAILADWGAEVIKIEHVERGDAMRGLGSDRPRRARRQACTCCSSTRTGASRASGSTSPSPTGLDILYQLAARCDVFLTNKMRACAQRLKIDVDDIRAHNPNIIYVRGTGLRQPRARRRRRAATTSSASGPARGVARRVHARRPRRRSIAQPGARVRRLDRRDDDRGRHRRRAAAPGAHRRGARRRRVAARHRRCGRWAAPSRVSQTSACRGRAPPAGERGRARQPAHRPRTARPTAASSCCRCCRASTTGPSSATRLGRDRAHHRPALRHPRAPAGRTPPPRRRS